MSLKHVIIITKDGSMRQLFLGDHLQRHYFVPLVHQVGLELLFEPETDMSA